jgi:Lar family restriction alleviation protein
MTQYTIKNCPFCGSEGELIKTTTGIDHAGTIQHTYKVKCKKCGAETRTCASRIFQDEEGVVYIEANGATDAIDLWNMRKEKKND